MVARKQGRPDLQAMLNGIETNEKNDQNAEEEVSSSKQMANSEQDTDLSEKIKRCYVITGFQLEKLMLLKTKKYRRNDLSEIICMAIDSFFDKEMNGEK